MIRASDSVLRAFCSTLIVLCLLAVGGRPAELQRVLDEQSSKVVPAKAHVQPPLERRTGVPDGQIRPQAAVPPQLATPEPPRAAILVEAQLAPALRFALFVHSGSPRGPPNA
jgi:hypothetical protein